MMYELPSATVVVPKSVEVDGVEEYDVLLRKSLAFLFGFEKIGKLTG